MNTFNDIEEFTGELIESGGMLNLNSENFAEKIIGEIKAEQRIKKRVGLFVLLSSFFLLTAIVIGVVFNIEYLSYLKLLANSVSIFFITGFISKEQINYM